MYLRLSLLIKLRERLGAYWPFLWWRVWFYGIRFGTGESRELRNVPPSQARWWNNPSSLAKEFRRRIANLRPENRLILSKPSVDLGTGLIVVFMMVNMLHASSWSCYVKYMKLRNVRSSGPRGDCIRHHAYASTALIGGACIISLFTDRRWQTIVIISSILLVGNFCKMLYFLRKIGR